MANLHNNQPILGVVEVAPEVTIHNGLPVIGVRLSAAAFEDNKVVLGVSVLTSGSAVSGGVSISRATVATYVGEDGSIKTAAIDEPRFDWATGQRALLLEKAATNLLTRSSASLATGWTKNSCDASDLTLNALGYFSGVLVASKGAIWQRLQCPNEFPVVSGTTYHVQLFVKFGTSGKVMLSLRYNVNSIESRFTIASTGEVSLIGGPFSNITLTSMGVDGVYRIDCNFIPTTSGNITFGVGPGGAVSGENMILLGAQFEAGTTGTSYIPTAGSAASRAADILLAFNDARVAGVVFIDDDRAMFNNAEVIPVTVIA